jgi:hypothetical protein
MYEKTVIKAKAKAKTDNLPNEAGFQWPKFTSQEAMREWLNTLPREDAEVDPRLKKRIPVKLNLHQLMVEGFEFLAKKQGIKSGRELMYIVLSQYLSNNLPEDF